MKKYFTIICFIFLLSAIGISVPYAKAKYNAKVYEFQIWLSEIFSLTCKEESYHTHKTANESYKHIDDEFTGNRNKTTSNYHELFKFNLNDKKLFRYSDSNFTQVEIDNFFETYIKLPSNEYMPTMGFLVYPSDKNIYIFYKTLPEEKYAIILKLYFESKHEFDTRRYFKTIYDTLFTKEINNE